jgi:hypothetical protein
VAILHIAKKYLATLVRNNIYISPFRKQSHLELIGSGLPEFSLFNVPKRGKPGAIVGANPTVFEFTATTPAL